MKESISITIDYASDSAWDLFVFDELVEDGLRFLSGFGRHCRDAFQERVNRGLGAEVRMWVSGEQVDQRYTSYFVQESDTMKLSISIVIYHPTSTSLTSGQEQQRSSDRMLKLWLHSRFRQFRHCSSAAFFKFSTVFQLHPLLAKINFIFIKPRHIFSKPQQKVQGSTSQQAQIQAKECVNIISVATLEFSCSKQEKRGRHWPYNSH